MKRVWIRWMTRLGVVTMLFGWLAVWSDYTAVTAVVETRPAGLILFIGATGLMLPGAIGTRSRSAMIGAGLSVAGLVVSIYLLTFAYGEEAIRFESEGLTLSGTLYTPRSEKAIAGVVFVHGSGASTGEYFRWYAKHFARHGIAALVYHKRGAGLSEGETWSSTYHDYAGDAAAAVRWMRERSEIPPDAVGLFGHSEGGWVAPLAVSILEEQEPAFVIVSSTTPMTAAEQVLHETVSRVEQAGFGADIVERARSLQKRVLEYQRTARPDRELGNELIRASEEPWFAAAELPSTLYPPEEYGWWRSVMDLDTRVYWTGVDTPVLAISGGRDLNADARQSQAELRALLAGGGNDQFTGVIFPEAEHEMVEWWLPGRIPPPRYPRGIGETLVDWIELRVANPPESSNTDADRFIQHLDEAVPALLESTGISGAAVGLVSDGAIVHLEGYGFADRDRGVPMTADTILNVASVSKTATAWGAMELVESGVISLDRPVTPHLTRWKIPESKWDADEVTLRRLLSHTAGVSLPAVPEYESLRAPKSLEEAMSGFDGVHLVGQPGAGFSYSGGGYMIVQLLIEELTGTSFSDWMRRNLFLELGMTSTSFAAWSVESSKLAVPYDGGRAIEPLVYKGLAAAGMYSTAHDLSVFVKSWLNGAARGWTLLDPGTVEEMMSPQPKAAQSWGLQYGLGYDLWPVTGGEQGELTAGHRGQNTGWSCVVWSNPSGGDALVVVTNDSEGSAVHRWLLCDWIGWSSDGGSFGGYCSGRKQQPVPWSESSH